jgi:Zn finger protein HypA/HybF involved in hydrogenase expression
MEIGELAAVEPDLLTFAWQAVTAEGPDADARLDVEWKTAIQRCVSCDQDKSRSEGTWLRICPDCGMPLEVVGGSELDVIDVTLEDETDGPESSGEEAR